MKTLISDIINLDNPADKLNAFMSEIQSIYEDIKIHYYEPDISGQQLYLSISNDKLIEKNLSFSILDTENPICFSFLSMKVYMTDKLSFFSNYSIFRKYFTNYPSNHKVLAFPIYHKLKKIGVFAFISNDRTLRKIKGDRNIQLFMDLYGFSVFKNKQVLELESQLSNYYSKIKRFESLEKLSSIDTHIKNNWVNETGSANKFYKDITRLIISDDNIFIAGDAGTGKTHLAKIMQVSIQSLGNKLYIDFKNKSSSYILYKYLTADYMKVFFKKYQNTTLLFDNIEYCRYPLQDRILEFLSLETLHKFNIRIISTSSKPIRKLEDSLLYTELVKLLSRKTLNIQCLLSRKSQVISLAALFIYEIQVKYNNTNIAISPKALNWLCSIKYKESVKELKQIIEKAYNISPEKNIINLQALRNSKKDYSYSKGESYKLSSLVRNYEKSIIENSIIKNLGNKAKSADELGVAKRTFNYKCNKYNL